MNILLPKEITYALETIQQAGFEAFIVGGCVRDIFIGREVHDFDITTNALPSQILQLFSSFTVLETGIKHGTLTVVINHMPIEITTYRIDGTYTDHRRPDGVLFTKSLMEDLKRRDFTMNALAYNPKTGIIDYFNGKEDIYNKIIRTVGSPDERFTEDGLRIMRALRFSAVLGFQIEEDTKKSIHTYKDKLKYISIERITSEFSKMICGQYVEEVLLEFWDIIDVIIPELSIQSKDDPAYKLSVKTLVNTPPILYLRMATLLHSISKQAILSYEKEENIDNNHSSEKSAFIVKKILQDMRFDKETTNRVYTLIFYYDLDLIEDKPYIKKWMNKLTPKVLKELLQLRRAKSLSQNSKDDKELGKISTINYLIDEIIASKSCYSIKGLAINGQDLIKAGIPQGKLIGEILQKILEEVIEEKVDNNKKDLLHLAKHMYGEGGQQICDLHRSEQ
ncbi:tRNA nucleotidyltransferase (CCA-adding enzyme) [Alkalibaculum bacchi]|uniref:tRNA nucleotidyltransferase (CCA-adding enzyme) n=1 Tax=Alkalibaculum bacchi TaxID=645887 RepID=A0A366IBQ4_9FIRM|nr:CCA tRNA nucleotidyltransferase [Alkalibaculum bacchi]RBP65932.1 tRNA nucleotidyltransferase (CCA-adding enzyme) [Alkalibaculum bacchi]